MNIILFDFPYGKITLFFSFQYELKKSIMDNLEIKNYMYSPGDCLSKEEATDIIKERFFNPKPVEFDDIGEENIEVCCPSYEGICP